MQGNARTRKCALKHQPITAYFMDYSFKILDFYRCINIMIISSNCVLIPMDFGTRNIQFSFFC